MAIPLYARSILLSVTSGAAIPPVPQMLRRLAPAALAILALAGCGGGSTGANEPETRVLGVSYERPAVTVAHTTSTTAAPVSTTTVAQAPTTTTAPPPPPPPPPPPAPAAAPAPTTGVVSGGYTSPDGNGTIRVALLRGDGSAADSRDLGPSGGAFSFDAAAGDYRLQITDVGPVVEGATTRTQSQVIHRTDLFTLEAGGAARFECDISTGCAGVLG